MTNSFPGPFARLDGRPWLWVCCYGIVGTLTLTSAVSERHGMLRRERGLGAEVQLFMTWLCHVECFCAEVQNYFLSAEAPQWFLSVVQSYFCTQAVALTPKLHLCILKKHERKLTWQNAYSVCCICIYCTDSEVRSSGHDKKCCSLSGHC